MSSNPYRKDFPLLENNKVIYLDNAATSQRPEAVIQAEAQFYEKYNANPLRGLYELSVEATDCYEEARETVRKFIGAGRQTVNYDIQWLRSGAFNRERYS